MMFPSIHLNGTSPRDLLEQQCIAMNALRAAIEALQAAGPNGRDYYPQGSTAFQAAQEEHQGRILKLRNVLSELEAIANFVSAAVR